MASVAQIEANRKNARKSTGPRTAEGIAACCRNATKHGLLSSQVLLRGESSEAWEEHVRGLRDELRPAGPMEELLADRIIAQLWRLKRVPLMEAAILNETLFCEEERPEEGEEGCEDTGTGGHGESGGPDAGTGAACKFLNKGLAGLDKLGRYERMLERSCQQALRDLAALQNARMAAEASRRQREYEREAQEAIRAAEEKEDTETRGRGDAEQATASRANHESPGASPANGTEPIPGREASGDEKAAAARQTDPIRARAA